MADKDKTTNKKKAAVEGDEAEGGEFAQNWKGLPLDFARGAETGPNTREIGVIVARMRDEFPGAGGNPIHEAMESHGVECAGGGYAECAVGGREAFFYKNAAPGGLKAAETADLRSTDEPGAGGGANGPDGFEWIAN